MLEYMYPSAEDYEAFRACLGEEYQDASAEELNYLLEEVLDGLTPEQVESFWKAVKGFGKKALKIGKKALPGVVSGATTGMSVGGPWGALVGGLAGGALSAARSGPATPKAARPRVPSARRPARRPARRQPASAQLLQLLQSPQLLQTLLSGVAGAAGRRSVPLNAGGTRKSVPVGGILNLLGSLANQAAVEAAEINAYESIPAYLLDQDGEALGDIANREERADILWDQLQEDELFLEGTDLWTGESYGWGGNGAVAEWFAEAGLVETYDPYEAELEWDD